MDISIYREEFPIYNRNLDYKGNLYISELCGIFSDISCTQSTEHGVGIDALNEDGKTWMLHELHIKIHKWPGKGHKITAETWPYGIKRIFVQRKYQVWSEGELMIEGYAEWMYVDMNKRRPLRQPDSVVEMCTKGYDLGQSDLKPIVDENNIPEMQAYQVYRASYDNIDFNKHVTQASYMSWIINSLPFDFVKSHTLREVEIVYNHEILPDNSIFSAYTYDGDSMADTVKITHTLYDESLQHACACTIWERDSNI